MRITRLLSTLGLVAAIGSAPALAAKPVIGGTIVTPVTSTATCDGASAMDVTLTGVRAKTNEITVYSTQLVGGYWNMTLLNASGDLVTGFGQGIPDISGGKFVRITTTVAGAIPRGTSTLSFVAQRHDPIADPSTSPVLETCTANLTVTTR